MSDRYLPTPNKSRYGRPISGKTINSITGSADQNTQQSNMV